MHICYSIADQNFNTAQSMGICKISQGLLTALAAADDVSLDVLANSVNTPSAPGAKFHVHDSPISGKVGRVMWDQFGCTAAAARTGAEWLFLPKGYASFLKPPRRQKQACYVHDVIFDLPDKFAGKRSNTIETRILRASFRATLEDSTVIFTNTEFSRQEIMNWATEHTIDPPPIHVVGYGFDEPNPMFTHSDQVVLFLAPFPFKRATETVAFTERWRVESGYQGKIVCVGTPADDTDIPDHAQWDLRGRVGHTELQGLVQAAQATVYASSHEGFGMPPVESILWGTASVYSDIPPTVEALGECGYAFENGNYESYRDQLNRAIATPQATVEAWIGDLSARHTWALVSERVVAALRSYS